MGLPSAGVLGSPVLMEGEEMKKKSKEMALGVFLYRADHHRPADSEYLSYYQDHDPKLFPEYRI